MMLSLKDAMAQIAQATEDELDLLISEVDEPENRVLKAMRHGCLNGGKRLRPFLVVTTARLFRVADSCAIRVAAALEMLHSYSLVHDDLPAMDDDDLRRGQPTVHKAFDEATAILAGDALLTEAFKVLSGESTHPDPAVRCALVHELAVAAGAHGMVGGQMIDVMADQLTEAGTPRGMSLPEITRMHQMKTGRLISYSCMAGCILGKAPSSLRVALKNYAHDLGIAFQIADDILDVEGSTEMLGKTAGKDEAAGKSTYVSLLGLEQAKVKASMLAEQACKHLDPFQEKADMLRELATFVVQRTH
jgi:farnesyl diphosphate synthase